MTKLTYFIKCKNGAYLTEAGTEKKVETANWAIAKGYAKAVKGEVIPHYKEKVTY